MTLTAGTRLGSYELRALIGAGGQSVILCHLEAPCGREARVVAQPLLAVRQS